MRMRRLWIILTIVIMPQLVLAADNRFNLATQQDFGAKTGFILDFENTTNSSGVCPLSSLRLICGFGDGQNNYFMALTPKWEYDVDYLALMKVGPNGESIRLQIDQGKVVAENEQGGDLKPAVGPLLVSDTPSWAQAPAEYHFVQTSLKVVSSSGRTLVGHFTESHLSPILWLFAPPPSRKYPWVTNPGDSLTIEAGFKIVQNPDLRSFAPVIDRYGQVIQANWRGKIKSDAQLKRAVAHERDVLQKWGTDKDEDAYGGWLKAGWKEKPTGFYRVVKHNGKWWLITPLGNPCFYTGICSAPSTTWETTPVTGREYLFADLPPKTGLYAAAWSKNQWGIDDDTEYCAFQTANLIREYGSNWNEASIHLLVRRIQAWRFCGLGKWCGPTRHLPYSPVLYRWDVPSLAGRPDIFDPSVQAKFRASLERQILPERNNPCVVGWSLGNEYDEIIQPSEIQSILKMPATVPAKKALVDYDIDSLHHGDLSQAADGLGVQGATTREELESATCNPNAKDLEALREFYADRYYDFIYKTIKSIDPNHLYLGFWIVPGWWVNATDWSLIAKHCDVIGYDRYAPDFADSMVQGLFKSAGKPVLCGEFSFPPTYNGARGFGVYPTNAVDDRDSGAKYVRWIRDAANNPYCVGCYWFEYRDEPVTGRGPGHGPDLIYGEHYAFGFVDVTDQPRYALIEQARQINAEASAIRNR